MQLTDEKTTTANLVLELLKDGKIKTEKKLIEEITVKKNINTNVIKTQLGNTKKQLVEAELINLSKDNQYKITEKGFNAYSKNITINTKYLNKIKNKFQEKKESHQLNYYFNSYLNPKIDEYENLNKEIENININLRNKIYTNLNNKSIIEFRKTIKKIISSIGYPSHKSNLDRKFNNLAKEFDEVIELDYLGINKLYIQAYQSEKLIDTTQIALIAEIIESLSLERGLLITMNDLSSEAKRAVKQSRFNIRYLNGNNLINLILEHKIGLSIKKELIIYDLED